MHKKGQGDRPRSSTKKGGQSMASRNEEQISILKSAAEKRKLMPVDGIILAIRLSIAQISGGGATKGGAVGPQVQHIEANIRIIISIEGGLGIFGRQKVEEFLRELIDLFKTSEKKDFPAILKEAFEVYGLEWTEPEPAMVLAPKWDRMVWLSSGNLVHVDKISNRAFCPTEGRPNPAEEGSPFQPNSA